MARPPHPRQPPPTPTPASHPLIASLLYGPHASKQETASRWYPEGSYPRLSLMLSTENSQGPENRNPTASKAFSEIHLSP